MKEKAYCHEANIFVKEKERKCSLSMLQSLSKLCLLLKIQLEKMTMLSYFRPSH